MTEYFPEQQIAGKIIDLDNIRSLIDAGGNCVFEMVEGGTITGGTEVIAYNRWRDSPTPSMGSIAYHSGALTGGSVILKKLIPGGEKGFAGGGGARADSEWIHKEATTTTWRITNIAGDAKPFSVEATFYSKDVS